MPAANAGLARVLFVDDHELFVEGLRALFAQWRMPLRLDSVPDVGSAITMLASGREYRLVLYDWHLRGTGGVAGLVALLQSAPGVRVLVVSGTTDDAVGVAARALGAIGFVSKAEPPERLREQVWSALQARPGSLPGVLERPRAPVPIASPAPAAAVPCLTSRQRQILDGLACGLPNKAIAARLNQSPAPTPDRLAAR